MEGRIRLAQCPVHTRCKVMSFDDPVSLLILDGKPNSDPVLREEIERESRLLKEAGFVNGDNVEIVIRRPAAQARGSR